ncbi:disintegrin and metalloproteinase domain-containing protein 32-like [Ochotona curzoniae]|uniref:disintegrin and metalloproteinase domain-containing protein 32-like n=1 Tax=Ochotona curzoniae TaxID=130825 RepID=UPI001B34AA98|nr:disintegrin and metalloproteinase domain-containing protein 32-like [Ochotona curzoniae]
MASNSDCSQKSLLQIVLPEKIQANTSDDSEGQISYIIPIDETLYTVNLKQRYFLADDFMVYLYSQGSVSALSSDIQPHCYYQGYIEGHPNSIATLSTCSGLRGLLQFENISYGIEPLESAVQFHHLLYKLGNDNKQLSSFNNDTKSAENHLMDSIIYIDKKPALPEKVFPLYLDIHIVVDKALYEYLGSDSMIVMNKIIEVIGLVNSMLMQFKVTLVLSSLDLWSDDNKISTAGEADELLNVFLKWKHSYLTFRLHDVAYLFVYRDIPHYLGAVFPGKICDTQYSAGIAVYPKGITLEAFSVIVTQMLGLNLGISYDDPKKCHCQDAICVMNPEAVISSGAKIFSNCSLNDFEGFVSSEGASCLRNKPQMQRAGRPHCGNGRVEAGEVCDCGPVQHCGQDDCCDPRSCQLKRGYQCLSGECCHDQGLERCHFKDNRHVCRQSINPECDIEERCSGNSADCPPDITVHNGQLCKGGRYTCYDGECHDLDARCEAIFGNGSKNAPFSCYEEIQSQADVFGNCGKERNKYKACGWRSLVCGRLICTYPSRAPFHQENAAVIYAFVRNVICVTINYKLAASAPDPLEIKNGSECETGRICVNRLCVESRILRNQSHTCSLQCNGHGVCNSQGACNCTAGYLPPNCQNRARGLPLLPEEKGLNSGLEAPMKGKKLWLLGLYIGIPVLIIATVLIMARHKLRRRLTKKEESVKNESTSEVSTHTHTSKSESSSHKVTSKSKSEDSTQEEVSRSDIQESTQTSSSSN